MWLRFHRAFISWSGRRRYRDIHCCCCRCRRRHYSHCSSCIIFISKLLRNLAGVSIWSAPMITSHFLLMAVTS